MNSDSIKADVDVSDPIFEPCTNVWGTPKTSKVGKFKCKEYKLTIQSNKVIEKKGKEIFEWEEDEYFNNNVTQVDHERRIMEDKGIVDKKEGTVKKENVKRSANLWLSNEFELGPNDFFTILEVLQDGGNIGMQRLNTYLQNDIIKSTLNENGFPVKISIPFGFTINAKVVFNNFKYLKSDEDPSELVLPENTNSIKKLFKVPKGLKKMPRKEGMKTLKSKKKRLAFANFNVR